MAWSGGKDSTLTLEGLLSDARYEITTLLTTVTARYERIGKRRQPAVAPPGEPRTQHDQRQRLRDEKRQGHETRRNQSPACGTGAGAAAPCASRRRPNRASSFSFHSSKIS